MTSGELMSDEQVVRLLEEIRDLQKQQVEHYKQVLSGQQQALANQQQALDTQKQVVRRSKFVLLLVAVLLVFLFGFPLLWWGLGWGTRCFLRH
jgi:cytoskeletal protein RodZ